MTEDCIHNHTSYSEESYFYKETMRLVLELRRMAEMMKAAEPRLLEVAPVAVIAPRAA